MSQSDMRATICVLFIIASLVAIPLAAQDAQPHRLSRGVIDPFELSGQPKKLVVLSPAKRALAQSTVFEKLNSKDPLVLASVLSDLTSFIHQAPTDTDLFIMRATVSCEIAGSNKEGMLRDIDTSIKLWKPDENSAFDSLRDHYAQKAKVEFLLGRSE